MTHGKVAYSTDIAVADRPEFVLLTLGNIEDVCYACHVVDYAYKDVKKAEAFLTYAPDIYKDDERKTWLMFDTMQKISVDFLDRLLSDTTVHDFIKKRANNKTL